MLSFYLSLFGAPNLEPIDAPANATGPAPTGLSTANLRANWGPSFAPGCELTDGLAKYIMCRLLHGMLCRYEFTDCLAIFFPCFTGTVPPTATRLGYALRSCPRASLQASSAAYTCHIEPPCRHPLQPIQVI